MRNWMYSTSLNTLRLELRTNHHLAYGLTTLTMASQIKLALEEAKAKYVTYYVDLKDNPVWFTSIVNPEGKVSILYTYHSEWFLR